MRRAYLTVLLIALGFGPVLAAHGQDDETPSLGDVARQARLAKQQKDAQTGNAEGQAKAGETPAIAPNDASRQSGTSSAQKTSGTGVQKADATNAAAKNAQGVKPQKKVLTNEDVGAMHISADSAQTSVSNTAESANSQQTDRNPPDYWTTRILAQKNAISSLKSDIDQLSASIQYTPPNCVSGCVEWNQAQQQKQQQVDTMKAQLEEQQKQLEEMQEAARKQGYGSSVYDP